MAFKINDRVKETTTSTGTGAVLLLGPVAGFQSFSSGVGTGNNTYYTIVEDGATPQWEVGNGTFTGTTLSRDSVYSSSNNNNLVVFASGVKSVYVDLPASQVPTASGSPLSVNGTVVNNPNLVTNAAALGTTLVATGSTITAAVRDADVSAVANREIGLLVGAPGAARAQISGGSLIDAVIINASSNPVQMTIKTVSSSTAILATLNALGVNALTISSSAFGGATLLVASYSALVFEIVATFPVGVTLAQVRAVFSPGGIDVRSDAVWYGGPNAGVFQFTQNNGNPRLAIGSLMLGSATVAIARDPVTNANTFSTIGTGGATALVGLTDVSIVEPTFAQVGTATVVSISVATTSITVTSATGIAVGDWLRGGTSLPGQLPALQVIGIVGALIEFNLDPTPFFVVGNFIYRLPPTIEGARLVFSNAINKWIASPALQSLPMDTIGWVSLANDIYITNNAIGIQAAPITTNVLNIANPWTFGVTTLPGFTSQTEVVGTDPGGRQVSGQYVSAVDAGTPTAVLEFVKSDRASGGGFVINNTYPMTWRQGTIVPIVSSANAVTGAITVVGGNSIGVATNSVSRQLTVSYTGGGSGINSSNFTSFVNDQFITPISFVATSVGTGYANEGYIGFGWNTDTEANDGGFLNGTKYIGTVQTTPTTPGNGLIYFVATTYTDLEVDVKSPAFNFNFTTSSSSSPGDFVLEGVLFSKKTSNAANPPILAGQIFPGFQIAASDDVRLIPLIFPAISITGSGTSFTCTVGAGQYSGIANNYAHTDTTTEYIIWFRLYNQNAADNISTITGLAITNRGGVRSLVSIPAAAVASSLAWDIYTVATRYNDAFTPVDGISATFTVPVATVTGTVHNYFRYSATGAATSIYRFVPTTDSVLTTLSYDSFWTGFTGSALTGLITQRGQF